MHEQVAPALEPMKPWDARLALWCVRPFRDSWLTPNHITTASLLAGLTSAALFAIGSSRAAVWAGLFYVLSALLDHADGELAREGNKASAFGHMYDRLCDLAARSALFLGLALNARDALGTWVIPCGVVGAASCWTDERDWMRLRSDLSITIQRAPRGARTAASA